MSNSVHFLFLAAFFAAAVAASLFVHPRAGLCTEKAQPKATLAEGFVRLSEFAPEIAQDIRYYSEHNFVGARIDGYLAPEAILARPAAEALKLAAAQLKGQGYGLKVFDSYRPTRAVAHFSRWAKDLRDTKMQKEFYPSVAKNRLFASGYLASKSGHSRGSTVDLTLIRLSDGAEVDMGGAFDFLDAASKHDAPHLTPEQRANRRLLKKTMVAAGFKPYSKEWWHYTLINEPYPKTYFDFPVQ